MKYLLSLLFSLFYLLGHSQTQPTGFPTQFNTGWQQWGYQQSLQGTIIAKRDTLGWLPRFTGTTIVRPQDRDMYFYDSAILAWKRLWNNKDTLTSFTLSLGDSSEAVATTKWVKQQVFNSGVGATNNVNIGSGFRPVNAITQEMRTYFAGFGARLDTVANSNGITWSSDTTRVTGLPTYFYVDSLPSDNISNTALTANGNYAQNWSNKQWYVDSIGGQFLFRMGGIGSTGTRRKEFRINWGGPSFGDNLDGYNILASIKKADLSADSLTMGLTSSGAGVLSMGTYDVATSANNTFISYSTLGLININARDSIWIKGAAPAATADSILGVLFRSENGRSKIVKIPLPTAGGGATLSNIGSGFRWVATTGGNIKTAYNSNTILWDSTSNTNGLTPKVDTSVIATQYDLTQIGGISGSGDANQITYWTGTSTVSGDAGLTINATNNTIISDTNRLKRIHITGDSTFSDKIIFYPSKTKSGSTTASIGFGESNNEHDLDTTVNNTLEARIGGVGGTLGTYIRWGMEKRWLPAPGAGSYWMESHPIEIRTLSSAVYRPISFTTQEDGDNSVMSIRGKTVKFHDLITELGTGGFSRSSGGITAYYNFDGTGVVSNLIRDTTTATGNTITAGFTISGALTGGLRTSTIEHHGQDITHFYETGPTFRSKKGGQGSSAGWNYVFNILDTNTNHVAIFAKGAGLFDNTYLWIHNDGRTVSGDAGFFFPGYKFQAKPQGSNLAFIAGNYDASNNSVLITSTFGHALTSGSGAAGMGAGFDFRADNTANTFTAIGDISAAWDGTPTATAENGDIIGRTRRAGVMTNAFRSYSTGEFSIETIDSTTTPDNMVYQDPFTKKLKKSAVPSGGSQTWQQTLTTGSTLTTNNTVTGGNNSFTFNGMFNYRVNANSFVIDKTTATAPYSLAVIGAYNGLQIGYTPTPATYSKGVGIIIDTNNNAGIGVQMPTTAPRYASGLNTYIDNILVEGAQYDGVTSITSNTTLDLEKYYIRIDATSGNVTVTLPAASTAFGASVGIHYVFKRLDNSGNSITITRAGSDTIDGGTSITLTAQYEVKEIICSSSSTWDVR